MKVLLLIFIFSCSKYKVEKSNLYISEKNIQKRESLVVATDQNIDMFVALIWPEKFEESESDYIKSIIQSGQNIRKIKDNYREKTLKNRCLIKQFKCNSLLESPQNQEKTASICKELKQEKKKNQQIILSLFYEVNNIQEALKKFKRPGVFIPTFTTINPYLLAKLNLENNFISIPSFGSIDSDYTTEDGTIFDFKFNGTVLSFSIQGKDTFKDSLITASLNMQDNKYFIQALGDIEIRQDNAPLKKGIMFFESTKDIILNDNCDL